MIRTLDGGMKLEDNITKFELINIFPFDDKFYMASGSVTSLEERTEKWRRPAEMDLHQSIRKEKHCLAGLVPTRTHA